MTRPRISWNDRNWGALQSIWRRSDDSFNLSDLTGGLPAIICFLQCNVVAGNACDVYNNSSPTGNYVRLNTDNTWPVI